MRPLLLLALLSLPPLSAHAQSEPSSQPSPTTTLTIQASLVALDALVRDPDGNLVPNLTLDDFTLRVDNHPQPLRYFNRDDDLPLTVGLLLDTSGSQHPFFDDEALAASLFLRNALTQPGDRAFVLRFDAQITPLQDLTASLPLLHNALRQLDYLPNTPASLNGTLLYDAIAAASQRFLTRSPGRRALIVLTDGEDNGSHADLRAAIRQAQLADVSVYTILYTHEDPAYAHFPAAHPSGILVMRQLADTTGGREFLVRSGSLTQIFAAIAEDLRSQYRVAFTPPPSKPGKYHSLDLKPRDPHLTLQTRTGYYTPQ